MLGSSLAHGAAKAAGVVKLAQAPVTVDAALERQVKAMLDRGIPLDTIVKQLADALATQVAAMLGISPQAAHEQLTQAFTQAFAAGGTGPPGETTAQRAAALVQTLRRIAEAATRVVQEDPGSSIRLIAGQRSDADTAKANPTPTNPDRLLRAALDALTAPVPPPQVSENTPGDGKTVVMRGAPVLASGGDTLLGRTLARAVLADGQRSAPADAVPVVPAALGPAAPAAPNAAVEAFLQAFAGALARADAGSAGSGSGDGRPSLAGGDPLRAPAPATASDTAPAPFALAFAQHASPVDPALAAPAPAPMPHVDPSAVMDQILRGMQIRSGDGQSEVRLRLLPEQLGEVSIKLVVSGGTVDASVTANSAAARDALMSGQSQLARTLADAGLKLASFSVGLAGGGFTGQRDGSDQPAWARGMPRRIGALGAADADEPDDELGLLAVPSFGPPIFSAKPVLGHNYLA